MANPKVTPNGLAVDRSGNPVVDPTANVLQLVEASIKRIDDLRALDTRRLDDLRNAESRRVDEQAALISQHQKELREAEAKRIDAIRVVDVNAVGVASERATQQANVLSAQVAQQAEASRSLVASTAASVAAQLSSVTTQLTDRLASLEKAQYENKGRSGFSDPLEAERARALLTLQLEQSERGGRGKGVSAGLNGVVVAVMLALALLAGILGAIAFVKP